MGLDMYAFTTRKQPASPVDFEVTEATEIHYWRKHPNLHGWMERLYNDKGGVQDFNCVGVFLTAEDIDRLEADVRAGALPHTDGFFFGVSTADRLEEDLEFIGKAREAFAAGLSVFYTSWW